MGNGDYGAHPLTMGGIDTGNSYTDSKQGKVNIISEYLSNWVNIQAFE